MRAVNSFSKVILFPSCVLNSVLRPLPQTLQEPCQFQKMAEFCGFRSACRKVGLFPIQSIGEISHLLGFLFQVVLPASLS